ncbi:hypothetical protein FDUTEX481_04086 [Tolypothrix sp. PCC 7601]|nr:hypothetical protein FDUTEX481_04086 [Tolypothrix sp. PCC 7601]
MQLKRTPGVGILATTALPYTFKNIRCVSLRHNTPYKIHSWNGCNS